MKPDEIVERVRKANHIVILHRDQVFFNSTDEAEMRRWEGQGARIVPHFTLEELASYRKRGKRVTPGWEVHVLPLVDPDWQADDEGNDVDVAPTRLRELCRQS